MFLRSIVLALFATLAISAADAPLSQGIMVGAEAGGSNQVQLDAGWAIGHQGYTLYGLHAGVIGQSNTPQGANFTKVSGYQYGFLLDMGRAFWIAGYEHVTKETKTTATLKNGALDATVVSIDKGGAYGKLGYKVGPVMLFGSYGTESKGMVGVGFIHHFDF